MTVRRGTFTRRDNLLGTLFACAPLVGFLLFGLMPMIFSVVLSFGKLQSFDLTDLRFVGFENYARIFREDKRFIKSIGNRTSILAVGKKISSALI